MSPELKTVRYARFVFGMQYLRSQFPNMSVTSWGRSEKRNVAVGGHLKSQHMDWSACDIVWDANARPPTPTLQMYCKSVGLEVVPEGDHDHIELAP